MTSCNKVGIKIDRYNSSIPTPSPHKNTSISKKHSKDLYNTPINELDLNIDNYELHDLYKLFNIHSLTKETLKEARNIVHKLHPDKGLNLNTKYFILYNSAYKKLLEIHEFNEMHELDNTDNLEKANIRRVNEIKTDYTNEQLNTTLTKYFENNPQFKEKGYANDWINQQFEKYKFNEKTNDIGYGDWLKSDEGIIDMSSANVKQSNMNEAFEKYKSHNKSVIPYKGVQDIFATQFGGSSLIDDVENGVESTSYYTDIRHAYTNTLINVCEQDARQSYRSIDEYSRAREQESNVTPYDKAQAATLLATKERLEKEEARKIALQLARQEKEYLKKQQAFYSDLMRITN